MKNRKEKVYAIIFWVIFTLYLLLTDTGGYEGRLLVPSAVRISFSYLFIYYSQLFFILPRFYERRVFLICLIGADFLVYAGLQVVIPYLFPGSHTETGTISLQTWYAYLIRELLPFLIISVIAWGTYENKKAITKIKIKKQKERLLLMNELGFLKNQFNAHITFNFLNYCYSKVHKDSNEIAEAIEVCSKMLRYSMSCRTEEKVLLSNEIEYIEDFIRLQKLLNEELKIVFFRNGKEQVYILPRILIHFIEHVFKQVNLSSGKQPLFLELNSCGRWIDLTVESEKRMSINLRVDQKRLSDHLDLWCKNKYVLEMEETFASYKCRLKLMI